MVLYWGCGTEARAQIEKEEISNVPNTTEVEGGRRLNIVVRGHPPKCHRCKLRRYLRKNFPDKSRRTRKVRG